MRKSVLLVPLVFGGILLSQQGKPGLKELLNDTEIGDGWIYDDIETGYREAKKTGKPLLVSFR